MKMKLMLLLLTCHIASAVKHSLVYFVTESSEVRNIPEFMAVAEVKRTEFGYCDSSKKILETRQDWVQKALNNDMAQLDSYNELCFQILPYLFRKWISKWQQLASQSEAVNTLQMIEGCEWDENTGEVNGVIQYGYNAENLLEFDLKTMKWIALKPEADIIEHDWNANGNSAETIFLTETCPDWLKKYLKHGNSTLLRKVFPSISLLWKTPSSPVSCHATGFYPQRAMMFWRKDGVEIHEGVDPGEILPNNDGTFQMSVGLNVSSVTLEEWKRYECVFQFSNAEDSIITNLNKTVNWRKNKFRHDPKILIIAAAVVLVVIIVAVTVIAFHKMKEGRCPTSSPHNMIELSERPHRQTEESTQC